MTPKIMKFVDYQNIGDGEEMKINETGVPEPAGGQVLIKVDSAGINRLDILQKKGFYPPPNGASDILGVEVAGTIEIVTENCNGLKKGDKVCALLTGGGYAEYAVADAATCLPIPAGLDMLQAASLPEAMFTVWNNIMDIGNLTEGQTLLIHGGTSGIGTAAIQLAKCFTATVFITARTDEKCLFCQSIGADYTINYQTQDFVQECLKNTSGKGINLILDMVAGDYVGRNIKAASKDGRIIMIAAIKGIKAEINTLALIQKRIFLTGSTLRSRNVEFKEKIANKLVNHVWPLIEQGKIKPVIHKVFPLNQVKMAHQLMESSEHCGKIILDLKA